MGWDNLKTLLSASYPELTFTLKSFALITSKIVDDSVQELVQVELGEALADFIVYYEVDFQDAFGEILNAI